MHERSRLSNLILGHWRTYRPKMVSRLEAQGQMEQSLQAAEDRATDILFSLISVQKLDYRTAWEEAMAEVLPPEE